MKTVYVMVEGSTEEEFINNSLAHYLKAFGFINIVPILLETSPGFFGGDVSFERYRLNAQNLLLSDPNAIVTSLIDYYQLRNDFPGYTSAMEIANKKASVEYIETQVSAAIINSRFIPYIQLHEFEGLLFSDIKGFAFFKEEVQRKVQYIINQFPNPELINDGKETAPSVRLKSLIPRYKKKFHGPMIALENGIGSVIAKCPRFKNWLENIISNL